MSLKAVAGGGGGGPTDLSPAVIKAPNSSVRNTITPIGDYQPLSLKEYAGQISDMFSIEDNSGWKYFRVYSEDMGWFGFGGQGLDGYNNIILDWSGDIMGPSDGSGGKRYTLGADGAIIGADGKWYITSTGSFWEQLNPGETFRLYDYEFDEYVLSYTGWTGSDDGSGWLGMNPKYGVGLFGNMIVFSAGGNATFNGTVTLPSFAGSGNSYVCVDNDGNLYRGDPV